MLLVGGPVRSWGRGGEMPAGGGGAVAEGMGGPERSNSELHGAGGGGRVLWMPETLRRRGWDGQGSQITLRISLSA